MGRAGAARAHGSADARQPVSQGAGRVLSARSERTGALPVTRDGARGGARRRSTPCSIASRPEYAETLAPAIDRVWRDEVDELRRDLGIWVQKIADEHDWRPAYFEFSFGLQRRRPRSAQPAGSGRGRRPLRAARIGRSHRASRRFRSASRHRPQDRQEPVEPRSRSSAAARRCSRCSYSLAIEQGLGKKVVRRRASSTRRRPAASPSTPIPINDYTRSQGLQVLAIIDRAVETRVPAGAPPSERLHVVRFPPGLRSARGRARRRTRRATGSPDLEALRSMR